MRTASKLLILLLACVCSLGVSRRVYIKNGATPIYFWESSDDVYLFGASDLILPGSVVVDSPTGETDPASTGLVRLPHNEEICWRNSYSSGDICFGLGEVAVNSFHLESGLRMDAHPLTALSVNITQNGGFTMEGATLDTNDLIIIPDDPTGTRFIYYPDRTGRLMVVAGNPLPAAVGPSWDAANDVLEFKGATGGYHFDGPVTWAGDGLGARLEMDLNLFEYPEVTSGKWAFYAKENGILYPEWYVENVTECVDVKDGPDACPGTMTADQTTGSAGDGYCDSFADWGSCYPVNNRQRVATSPEDIPLDKINIEWNETLQQLEFGGAIGGYFFDGPVTWASDGLGARMEMDVNLFEHARASSGGKAAFYVKEDGLLNAAYHGVYKVDCVDQYDGSTAGGTCPGTMTADQTGGTSGDGYCDDFDDWGSCLPVERNEKFATDKARLLEKTFHIQASSLTSATNWMGAKCFGQADSKNSASWCNDPTTRIPVPFGHEVRIESITIVQGNTDLTASFDKSDCTEAGAPYACCTGSGTGPTCEAECTLFVNVSNERDTDGGCNQPGDASDTQCRTVIDGRPLAHIGLNTITGGWPRLDELGEVAFFDDFDQNGSGDDYDLRARGWWRLQVDHRHECDANAAQTITSFDLPRPIADLRGAACWNNDDCRDTNETSGLCVLDTNPFNCIALPHYSVSVLYSIHKVEAE